MASEGFCEVNLGKLTAGEQEQVKKDITRLIRKAELNSDISDINEAVMVALDDYQKMVEVAAKIEKRNAYLNRVAQYEIYDYISTNWKDNPAEGLYAFLVGSQREEIGARRSVAVSIEVQQNRYKNVLRAKLTAANLMQEAKSGKFDKEVFEAMDALHKGKDVSDFSDTAVNLARVYDDVNKMIRSDANKSGAVIGELDGFVVSRHHDMFKVRQDKQGWVDWMMQRVDWDRSFPGIDDVDKIKMLEKQANEFASGAHITMDISEGPGKGFKGYSSVAKRMSKNRVFHFKEAADEFEYGVKWGEQNLLRSIISSAESRGRSIGMMKRLGPNPEMNLDKVVEKYINDRNKSGLGIDDATTEKFSQAVKNIKKNVMPVLTGRAQIPGDHVAATVESLLLSVQRTSSLGGSAITSLIGDSSMHAYNVMRMDQSVWGLFKGYGEYASGLFRNLNDPEVQELLADMAVTNDFLIGTLPHRFGTETASITKAQRGIQNIENQFFFWNGQYFVDTRARAQSALGMATRIGKNTRKSFDELKGSYKTLFNTHGIDAADWDIMRQSLTKYNDIDVIDIEGISGLPDNVISGYMSSKGIKDNPYNRQRAIQDLIDRTRGMFQDQQGYSIFAADTRLRAMMFGGDQAGTAMGAIRKSFWQFKQFPMALIQRVYGREIYSKSPFHAKVMNLSAFMMVSLFAGYTQLVVTDLRKGREPRLFTGDPQRDRALVMESFFRGGGGGVYGDFLYNMLQDKYGNSPLGKFMGPTYGDVESLSKGIGYLMMGDYEKGGDILARVGMGNIPFANIPPLKAGLDYLILNQMQELVSPGILARSEQRLREEKGQEYMFLRPSETMLFGN